MKGFNNIENFFTAEEAIDYLKKCKGLFIDSIGELTEKDIVSMANSVYSIEEYVKNRDKK